MLISRVHFSKETIFSVEKRVVRGWRAVRRVSENVTGGLEYNGIGSRERKMG